MVIDFSDHGTRREVLHKRRVLRTLWFTIYDIFRIIRSDSLDEQMQLLCHTEKRHGIPQAKKGTFRCRSKMQAQVTTKEAGCGTGLPLLFAVLIVLGDLL